MLVLSVHEVRTVGHEVVAVELEGTGCRLLSAPPLQTSKPGETGAQNVVSPAIFV